MTKKRQIWCVIKSILSAMAISYILNIANISIWAGIAAVVCYCFFYKTPAHEKRFMIYTYIIGGIFALLCVLTRIGAYESILRELRVLLLTFLGLLFLFQYMVGQLFLGLDYLREKTVVTERQNKRWFPIIIFLSIVLLWLPNYLRNFPALMSLDSIVQAEQIAGLSPLSNHHPVAHTFLMGVVHTIAQLFTQSEIGAYGVVCFVQMITLAAIFTVTICFLSTKTKYLWIGAWAFFALCPVNAIYSVTLWKDIAFAGVVLLFLVALCSYLEKGTQGKKCVIPCILLGILGVLLCLFRSNGYYAFILFTVVFIICFVRKHRLMSGTLLVAIILATVIKGPVYNAFGIQQGDILEKLAIPIQNVAYIVVSGKIPDQETYDFLNEIVDVERVSETFYPFSVDATKGLIREKDNLMHLEQNKAEYFMLWLKLGIRYPREYVISWVNQTKGYWYPDTSYWVCWSGITDNQLGITQQPLLPEKLITALDTWNNAYTNLPVFGGLWCIGTYTWILLAMTGYALYTKARENLVLYSLLIFIWASLLAATPIFAEFRYFYAIVVATPLMMALPVIKSRKEEENHGIK